MQQVTIYSPGEIGSSRTPRMLTTAPATQRMRIMPKGFNSKVKSTCLPLGGKIKATLLAISHVDSVGPEPGVGYGWFQDCNGQPTKNNGSGMFVNSATCGSDRSGKFSVPEHEAIPFRN